VSLADIASADLANILNSDGGCVTLQSPDGRVAAFRANTQDISHAIDPQTGMLVSGRTCSVALTQRDLRTVNMEPIAVSDNKVNKPWVVRFAETASGKEHTFKVKETKPDRTIGALILILETYGSK
jgi:hypothetical protein